MNSKNTHINFKSLIYIIIGSVFLVFSLDVIYKITLLVVGLGFIFYGFSLRGFNGRFVMQRFFMNMFR